MNGKKNNFRVIPVIDIMNGIAVNANKGLRNTYSPLKTKIINSSDASDLLNAYYSQFGFEETYIADLDSIIKEKPNLELLTRLNNTEMNLLVDIGIRNMYDIFQLSDIGNVKVIVATETVDSFEVIKDAIKHLGTEKIIVSIDMREQILLYRSDDFEKYTPITIINDLVKLGIKEFILLDLTKIGTKEGCLEPIYEEIRKNYPNIDIIIGGGAKDVNDLYYLKKNGMNGILIATSIHQGLLTSEDYKKFIENI